MFGTLRLNPQLKSVDFVERADGKSFSDLGSTVPPHSACTYCRSKKLRCGGQKPICFRCKSSSVTCVYAAVDGTTEKRRGNTGQKRNHGGDVATNTRMASPVPERPRTNSSADKSAQDLVSSLSTSVPDSSSSGTPSSTSTSSSTSQGHSTAASSVGSDKSDKSSPQAAGPQDPTSCVDPSLLNEAMRSHLSSHSSDSEFQFFLSDSATNHEDGPMDLDDSLDIHIGNDFNVDMDALWSVTSAESLSYLGAHDAPTPSASASHISLLPTSGLSGSSSISSRLEGVGDFKISNGNNRCARQCLYTITPLLEEVEHRMHSMKPPRLEGILSWQKEACQTCFAVLHCPTCYSSSEHMMLLIMFCDKLIMLTQKLLWHTTDESSFHGPISMRDYEMNDPNEMIAFVRFFSGYCVKKIAQLLAGVKSSPAIEGKQVQLMMIRNIEQQVAKTLNGIRDNISVFVD